MKLALAFAAGFLAASFLFSWALCRAAASGDRRLRDELEWREWLDAHPELMHPG